MSIQILDPERWEELREIFAKEFNSDLPHKGKSAIIAEVDENGEIQGFLVTETLIRVGLIHNPGNKAKGMFSWLLKNMLPDSAVIAIASSKEFEPLCEAFKMRRIDGVVYRRDF
jgi:hypothetical protein